MLYHAPVNAQDPNAGYVNANAQQGIQGSSPPAESIEYPQREILNAITYGGLIPTDTDLTQLWQVINNSSKIYVVDAGTTNNIVLTPRPLLLSYTAGIAYEIKIAATNTGPTVINSSGLGNRALLRMNQSQLQAGDIVAGGVALVVFDGLNFQLLTSSSSQISEQSLLHYGVDTGPTNTLIATVTPGVQSYSLGLTCLIAVSHTNTGAVLANIQGMGLKNVIRSSGATLLAGDISAGCLALIAFDGTNFELLNVQVAGAGGPSSLDESIVGPLRPYFIAVISATVVAPPGSPAIGDTYLVPVGATGAWSGLGNQVTQWAGAVRGWVTVNMPLETMVGVADQDDFWKRTLTGWRTIFASLAEAAAGVATNLAVTPADLARSMSIQGPLRPPFIAVNSVSTLNPPGSPAVGDTYVVPAGATGAWTGFANYITQWTGSAWLFRFYPLLTFVGVADTGDLWQLTPGGWRTIWASLAEALAGTSTILGITPADLAYVLSHQPGSGDDLQSDLFYYGCF